ncbi:MAG: hypothetical protein QOG77_4093 [Solirubrobacteraceae bacterium]|nr:hypothetical protein [Solirubrobacteraceae bacterium]
MGDLGGGPLQIALIQTATTLPVFLLVIPAGALGDILDRRRLLLTSQSLMVLGAAGLAAITAAGLTTPTLLLALTAVLGVGAAMALPAFAAIQPELVPRETIPQAALLNGANLNVARAVGPALGGLLVSSSGPEAAFALNAVAAIGLLTAVHAWERAPDERVLGAEHLRSAIVAGARYVRSAPAFATVMARTLLFGTFASALWALLPVVARGPLDLGAGGYGVLLASVGAGAVTGAFILPGLRRRTSSTAVVTWASCAYATALLVVGVSQSPVAVILALGVAGLAWIGAMSTLSACAQLLLPDWIRSRGLAIYQLAFMAGQALGSLAWGVVAEAAGLEVAFALACGGLLGTAAVGARWLLLRQVGDIGQAAHWPEPSVVLEPSHEAGPILVTVEWRVRDDAVAMFVEAMRAVGRARRRTGASRWELFRDTEDPAVFLETFVVETWQEHLRQHLERQTAVEQQVEAVARRYLAEDGPPRVRHLVSAYGDR